MTRDTDLGGGECAAAFADGAGGGALADRFGAEWLARVGADG